MIRKYFKRWMIPTLIFFSASIFIADQIRKMGGIKDIFDIDDEDDL
jgi:hypothetical protein